MNIPLDTTPDAHAAQGNLYRKLGGTRRLDVAFELSATVRRLATAGILARHPDYTDERSGWRTPGCIQRRARQGSLAGT